MATIQVILQGDVENVGGSGDLVKVRPGYARNYLFPRSLAVPATTAQINRLNHEKAVALARNEKLKKEAREHASKLSALSIRIPCAVGEDDKLFGSVTAKEIHAAVKAQGVDFDRKKMKFDEPIKQLGTYEIPVKLLSDIVAILKVEVVKK